MDINETKNTEIINLSSCQSNAERQNDAVQKLNSIWSDYKSQHITEDAEGLLDEAVNSWIEAHKDDRINSSLVKKFTAFLKSGSIMRFFVSSGMCDKEYKQTDTNQDGTVSWNELYEYIDANVFQGSDLSEYANILGIRIEPQPLFDKNGDYDEMQSSVQTFRVLKQEILNTIKEQQNADLNNDNIVSYDEAVKASNDILNRLYGIVDGNMNNKQGTCGSCYILTAQTSLMRQFPDLYSKIVQTYDSKNPVDIDSYKIISGNKNNIKDGDVIIKFHGIKAKDGQKCAMIIPRSQIIAQQRENNLRLNLFQLGLSDDTPQFGSSDPDAVAMELAIYNLAPMLGYGDIALEDFLDIGGASCNVVEWLTGAKISSTTEENVVEQALNEFTKESKLIYFANFKDYFKSDSGNNIAREHAYYITDIAGNTITLTDSTDSNITHNCTIKEFLKHILELDIADISTNTVNR